MPRERSAAPTRQQCKAIAQSRFYLLNPKCLSAGCGELDGERYASRWRQIAAIVRMLLA